MTSEVNKNGRIPLLPSCYLERLGAVVYLIGRLEWAVLGELERLTTRLPDGPSLIKLASKTTGVIAAELMSVQSPDATVTAWLRRAGECLVEASHERNHVIHARPAATELVRWRLVDSRGRPAVDTFGITKEWLDALIAKLDAWCCEIEMTRPL